MLRCNDCGHKFSDDELAKWEENRGEFWGVPCTEKLTGCPYCFSGDYEPYNDDEDGEEDDG